MKENDFTIESIKRAKKGKKIVDFIGVSLLLLVVFFLSGVVAIVVMGNYDWVRGLLAGAAVLIFFFANWYWGYHAAMHEHDTTNYTKEDKIDTALESLLWSCVATFVTLFVIVAFIAFEYDRNRI
jgi:protein-S-isoprenylcysteine O-methyltransferase Ste14